MPLFRLYSRRRLVIFVFIGICIFIWVWNCDDENDFPYPLLQSNKEVEFPTAEGLPRIPHIIHQIFDDEDIPQIFTSNVKSFIKNNPSWEYRFWTYGSGRRLLAEHHPYLVDTYDAFGTDVKKADLLRFAALYEYGGFYSDLDVDNLRSLDKLTIKYACVIPVEPFENSVFLHDMPFLISSAVMICRPKHPFLKQLLRNLEGAHPDGYPVATTGPGYVTQQFCIYNNIEVYSVQNNTDASSNSPNFYKGTLNEDDNDAVYIPNSQYLMDNLNPINLGKDGKFTKLCSNTTDQSLLFKQACMELKIRKAVRENKEYTFTVHHWYHLWDKTQAEKDELEKINIRKVVPKCILFDD